MNQTTKIAIDALTDAVKDMLIDGYTTIGSHRHVLEKAIAALAPAVQDTNSMNIKTWQSRIQGKGSSSGHIACHMQNEIDELRAALASKDSAAAAIRDAGAGLDWPHTPGRPEMDATPAQPLPGARRDAALEEAAKACDFQATWSKGEAGDDMHFPDTRKMFRTQRFQAERCAAAIRALKSAPSPANADQGGV